MKKYIDGIEYDMTPEEIEAHNKFYADQAVIKVDEQWNAIRQERNQRLAALDWTQMPDVTLSDELKAEYAAIRQELRDITNQADPFNIIWPTNPYLHKPDAVQDDGVIESTVA